MDSAILSRHLTSMTSLRHWKAAGTISEKTIIMEEKGFDAASITQEDVDKYGI